MTFRQIRKELGPTLSLAAPIMAGQLAQMLIGLADTLMVGQVSVTALAACAFANNIIYIPFLFALGLLTSTAVLTSQAVGAKEDENAAETLRHGLILAVFVGVLCLLGLLAFLPAAPHLGQPPEVVAHALKYFVIVSVSLVPALVSAALKNHCEALNLPWLAFWVTMGGVVLNVFLNWVLIFGHLGAPALGLDGAGWATLIARAAVGVALFFLILFLPRFAATRPSSWLRALHREKLARLFAIGVPSGSQLLLEVSAFSMASFMMGWISANALAAHQIAITCAATTFMMPLGLSMALTIRLGQCMGGGEFHRMRVIAAGAFGATVAGMGFLAAVILVFQNVIAAAFVNPAAGDVIALAAQLLAIAGLFQIFDGLQVVSVGGLRGLADVNWPLWITVVCYWGVSLPVAYVSAFLLGFGAPGVWYGLLMGLGCLSLCLGLRLWHKTRVPQFGTTSPSPF